MANRVELYKQLLRRLLPPGKAWECDEGSVLSDLLGSIAVELARVHDRSDVLLIESDPRTTSELLEDWERICGLPDDCTGLAETVAERRSQILARLLLTGPMNKQFFVDLANALGYTFTTADVGEYRAFRADLSRVDDGLYNDDGWRSTFSITAPLNTIRPFRAGSHNAGDRLTEFGDDVLECVITDHKPAHSQVIFIYE
jgi:uncharacterized protein YmfQ (DUF2313 family)